MINKAANRSNKITSETCLQVITRFLSLHQIVHLPNQDRNPNFAASSSTNCRDKKIIETNKVDG
jgi:hypothetical protein